MNTRRTSCVLMAAVVSTLTLAAWPRETELEPIPVQGMLFPDGHFKGALTIQAVTAADAGQLRLTGVLDGIVTQRAGAKSVDLRLSVALMCLFRRLSRPEEGSSWTHAWPVSPLHWIAQPCRCARTAPAA